MSEMYDKYNTPDGRSVMTWGNTQVKTTEPANVTYQSDNMDLSNCKIRRISKIGTLCIGLKHANRQALIRDNGDGTFTITLLK